MEDGQNRAPDRFRADESAAPRLPPGWSWSIPLLLLVATAILAFGGPDGYLVVGLLLGLGMAVAALARAAALLAGLLRRRHEWCEDAPLDENDPDLPVYTVMVPLHREAAVIDHLLHSMDRLRYPRSRLRIRLLVEEDDASTRGALAARSLPESVAVVVVPPGVPRTKPRACNYALADLPDGLAVVFDAEDRPDPDQLLRAAAAFRGLPDDIACLQARLAADTRAKGLVGRLWGLEYAAWFDLFLPGLHAVGAPIPLGGTSNHFRAHHLRRLRWDAWNVTEDAELGIRIARAGLSTGVLASTTWEDAPPDWSVWLRQRGRWLKGWWLTAANHLADPQSLGDLGLWRWLWMVQLTLGTVLTALLLPLSILLAASWLVCRWPLADPLRPWTWLGPVLATGLLLLHGFFLAAHATAAAMRRSPRLLCVVPLIPFAWAMASVAAWRGYLQSIRQPHRWDKTPHAAHAPVPPSQGYGVTRHGSGVQGSTVHGSAVESMDGFTIHDSPSTIHDSRFTIHHSPSTLHRTHRVAAGLFLLLVGLGLAGWAVYSANLRGLARSADEMRRQMRRDAFVDLVDTGLMPDADWSDAGNGRVVYTMKLESECPEEFEVMAWMKCWDGTWFERSAYPHATNVTQRLAFPLDEGWHNKSGTVRFSPAWLLRVRETGLRLRGPTNMTASLSLDKVETLAPAVLPALAASNLAGPAKVAVHDVWDLRFDLNRALGNPFDAEQVDLRCTAEGPDGARLEVPCFFVLDHRSTAAPDGSEVMVPLGAPRWGARISPDRPGTWRVKISGHDPAGALVEQDLSFLATASDLPGPVKTAGRWFSRDTRFFYPVTINLRSPHDDLLTHLFKDMAQPSPNSGTLAMEPWIRRCADNGLNWMRVWTMPGSLGLEWERGWKGYHGRGVYNLANASRLDRLFAAARERRVTVELALWQHGPWTRDVDTQWADNPWNRDNGGPLKNPQDALKDPLARAGQRNLIRYAASRWGPDPALAAWTLWIEIDGTTRENTSAWHAEMAEAMKSFDPLDHPVSAEFRSPWGDSRVFSLPGIDFTQVAAYDSGGLLTTFRTRANTFARYDKPVILEEYGGHSTGGSGTWLAQQLHDGPWAAWNMNFSASPMGWWWNLIFAERLDRHYARFADYIRGEDLSNGKWRLEESGVEGTTNLMAVLRLGETRAYAWIYRRDLVDVFSPLEQNGWWRHAMMSSTLYDLRRGAWNPLAQEKPGEQFAEDRAVLNLTGKGLRPGRWRYELWDTWTADPPAKGEMTVGDSALLTLPPLRRDVAIKLMRVGE